MASLKIVGYGEARDGRRVVYMCCGEKSYTYDDGEKLVVVLSGRIHASQEAWGKIGRVRPGGEDCVGSQ